MNKLYIIGDLWETTAHKPKDYYVDGSGPKRNYQLVHTICMKAGQM